MNILGCCKVGGFSTRREKDNADTEKDRNKEEERRGTKLKHDIYTSYKTNNLRQRIYISDRRDSIPLRLPNMCLTIVGHNGS